MLCALRPEVNSDAFNSKKPRASPVCPGARALQLGAHAVFVSPRALPWPAPPHRL
jgi:hypothetical protein